MAAAAPFQRDLYSTRGAVEVSTDWALGVWSLIAPLVVLGFWYRLPQAPIRIVGLILLSLVLSTAVVGLGIYLVLPKTAVAWTRRWYASEGLLFVQPPALRDRRTLADARAALKEHLAQPPVVQSYQHYMPPNRWPHYGDGPNGFEVLESGGKIVVRYYDEGGFPFDLETWEPDEPERAPPTD